MQNLLANLNQEYIEIQEKGLKLDMTRGKPSSEQLALSEELLQIKETKAADGTDCRNYGGLEGIPEARAMFGEYLGASPEEVLVGGNSSLALMHDIFVQELFRGRDGNSWSKTEAPCFLCPVPGYDRHFTICELYGIKMLPIPMHEDGPDISFTQQMALNPSVVGIWCVPKYSNPTGATYSAEVVRKLASMPTGNPGFRIFWDNAYAVHDLKEESDFLLNILDECKKHGTEDRVYMFGSTSKITFAGAGISAVAMSEANLKWFCKGYQGQTIGPDKLNQRRHALFLQSLKNIQEHMGRHREILKPKFVAVNEELSKRFSGDTLVARWTKPNGGYFIDLKVEDDCATRVVELAKVAGVKLTPAGATFPYGIDPHDNDIRIAPSFPRVEEVRQAMNVVGLCIQIASAEKAEQ